MSNDSGAFVCVVCDKTASRAWMLGEHPNHESKPVCDSCCDLIVAMHIPYRREHPLKKVALVESTSSSVPNHS